MSRRHAAQPAKSHWTGSGGTKLRILSVALAIFLVITLVVSLVIPFFGPN